MLPGAEEGELWYAAGSGVLGLRSGRLLRRTTGRSGVGKLRLHRIWATCLPENPASGRVLEKVGMRKEGFQEPSQDPWRVEGLLLVRHASRGLGIHRAGDCSVTGASPLRLIRHGGAAVRRARLLRRGHHGVGIVIGRFQPLALQKTLKRGHGPAHPFTQRAAFHVAGLLSQMIPAAQGYASFRGWLGCLTVLGKRCVNRVRGADCQSAASWQPASYAGRQGTLWAQLAKPHNRAEPPFPPQRLSTLGRLGWSVDRNGIVYHAQREGKYGFVNWRR